MPLPERKQGISSARLFALWLAIALILTYGSLVPLNYQPLPLDEAIERFLAIRDLDLKIWNRADWVANLLLYIPLGFVVVLAASRFLWRLPAAILSCGMGIALAFLVEFLQLWFPGRTVSQNDLRAEAIGTCGGALLGLVAVTWGPAILARARAAGKPLLAHWGVFYVVALLGYSIMPADFVTSADEFRAKCEAGRVELVPSFSMELGVVPVLKRAAHVLCFVPVGWIATEWLSRRGDGTDSLVKCVAWAGLSGVVLSCLIEVIQLPIYSRESATTALVFGAVGAGGGGVLHTLVYRPACRPGWLASLIDASQHRAFWAVATIGYAVVILGVMLAPFGWVADPEDRLGRWNGMFRAPFSALYVSSEFQALTNILEKGLIFFVLGVLLWRLFCYRPNGASANRWMGGVAVALAALLGAIVEFAQVFLSSHMPGITDILIYTCFSAAGFFLVKYAAQELESGGVFGKHVEQCQPLDHSGAKA